VALVWNDGRVLDRLKPAFGLAALSVTFVLLSGCGSSSKPSAAASATTSSTAASSSTKARFVAQAEAICSALQAQEKPLQAQQEKLKALPSPTIDTAFVALVRKVVTDARAAESKLSALPRPTSNAHPIERLLNAFAEETMDANGIAKAANLQEATLGELAAKDLQKSVAKNKALAAEYGMGDCIGAE
jgi:hypothetical protein